MSLGPDSQMVIDQFPENDPGVITLVKGQLRSQVSKENAPAGANANKSKLFIKTKTAAMGIRGTDLQTNFNPENGNTATVTFEGQVAATKMNDNRFFSPQALEKMIIASGILTAPGSAIMANPNQDRMSEPVKINPGQLSALRDATDKPLVESDKASLTKDIANQAKGIGSISPPGIPLSATTNDSQAIDAAMTSEIGANVVATATAEVSTNASQFAPPEGFYDAKTGSFAPPAGGFVDLNTGLYIPPPPGSAFDANTGVFIPPANFAFDPKTGEMAIAMETADGKIVALEVSPQGTLVVNQSVSAMANSEANSPSGNSNVIANTENNLPAKNEMVLPAIAITGKVESFGQGMAMASGNSMFANLASEAGPGNSSFTSALPPALAPPPPSFIGPDIGNLLNNLQEEINNQINNQQNLNNAPPSAGTVTITIQ
jgi:hypothetical protein